MNKKMACIDIDPFGEHESRTEEPTDENIPLDLVTSVGGGRWTLRSCSDSINLGTRMRTRKSFGGTSHTSVLHKEYLVGKIYELIGNKKHQRLEPNLSLFKLGKDGRLYYKGNLS